MTITDSDADVGPQVEAGTTSPSAPAAPVSVIATAAPAIVVDPVPVAVVAASAAPLPFDTTYESGRHLPRETFREIPLRFLCLLNSQLYIAIPPPYVNAPISPEDEWPDKWYVVTRGTRVGIFTTS